MCPMRFVLIFFSLIVAGFLALQAFSMTNIVDPSSSERNLPKDTKARDGTIKPWYAKVSSGLWALLDMATGSYLWRILVSPSSR
ncbi:hypothetical protein KP509_37G046100 [Ceratopteris richardii]|uniref:Uncharacterized protein n=1 Tax=Ceratopteris richardii TaxID=49495 RepID=A0A8T2Q8M1_CERRI|nr:hypothetical protein KP509_37G046100 [Ceratopteris richardii]